MKHLILAILAVCLIGSVSLADVYPGTSYPIEGPIPIPVGEFTISNSDLATFSILATEAQSSPLAAIDMTGPDVPGEGWDLPNVNNTEFNFLGFDFGNETWASGQIGWSMYDGSVDGYWGGYSAPPTADDTLPEAYYDLSMYDSFTLSFHNEVFAESGQGSQGDPGSAVMAALFINTGYTDEGVPDIYIQSEWTWALPCDNLILELDFANPSEIYGDGDIGDLRLDQISSLGVIIGTNLFTPGNGYGLPDETAFKVCIDTVPVPGAILLGILGLSVAGIKLRKFA